MKKRVFFLHNVIAPYRLPIFEAATSQFDMDIYFCKAKTNDRKWDASLEGYRFKAAVLHSFQLGPFFVNLNILKPLLTRRYDLYVVGDFPETALSTFLTIFIAKLRRKPVTLWSETVDNEVNYFPQLVVNQQPWQRLAQAVLKIGVSSYRRLLLSLPDTFIALSEHARTFLLSQEINPSRIYSGIQVVPKTLLDPPNEAMVKALYPGKTVLLYLGYFNAVKGINHLITAVKQLPQPQIQLLIVGAGPEEESLKKLAASDPRIDFAGYAAGETKASFMARADLFVLPTLVDCWALVVNEALYYGTPVITTPAAGASEIIQPGVNGFLIPPRSPKALATKLEELLAHPQLLKKLRQGAATPSPDITDVQVGAKPVIDAMRAAVRGRA